VGVERYSIQASAALRLQARYCGASRTLRTRYALGRSARRRSAADAGRRRRYNRDDCVSTLGCAAGSGASRGWRPRRRQAARPRRGRASEAVDGGLHVRRSDAAAASRGAARAQRGQQPVAAGLPPRLPPGEDKVWWEYFRLQGFPRTCSTGGSLRASVHEARGRRHRRTGRPTGSVVDRYRLGDGVGRARLKLMDGEVGRSGQGRSHRAILDVKKERKQATTLGRPSRSRHSVLEKRSIVRARVLTGARCRRGAPSTPRPIAQRRHRRCGRAFAPAGGGPRSVRGPHRRRSRRWSCDQGRGSGRPTAAPDDLRAREGGGRSASPRRATR
jgi:hypothetical protein